MFYDAIIAAYPDMNIIASITNISAPGNASLDYHEYSVRSFSTTWLCISLT